MKTDTWTAQQKKALRGSIRKWERIVSGKAVNNGSADCPCCLTWLEPSGCDGCPIKEYSGEDLCRGTPYANGKNETRPQRELKFLKKLYVAGGGVVTRLRKAGLKMIIQFRKS